MAGDQPGETLYVFMDESGNFDFSAKGTDHFLVSAYFTRDPLPAAQAITTLRYQLLHEGYTAACFHATEDKQWVRDRVFDTINDPSLNIRAHTLWVDKHYASPKIQNPESIMAIFGKAIARWLDYRLEEDVKHVVLLFDSALTAKQRGAFNAKVKPVLKRLSGKYTIHFQPVKQDPCGQIADYIAWANLRRLERGDLRPMGQLSNATLTEFDLFRNGHTRYY